ncbi:MAG: hypothetical protein U0414_29570 [Polyangiaceae bacterium]
MTTRRIPWTPTHALALVIGLALALGMGACGELGASSSSSASTAAGSAVGIAPSTVAPPAQAPPATASPLVRTEGASIAVAPEGDLAVIADEDHSALVLLELPITEASRPVKLETSGQPSQVLFVGRELLVTIRDTPSGGGALVAYARGSGPGSAPLTEARRIRLPADAWGVAVSPDGGTAAVTSAWTAKVSLLDVASGRILATRDVAREPRGVAFTRDGDTVYVTHLIGAELTKITRVHADASPSRVALPASPSRSPANDGLSASLGYAIAMTPDRARVFAPRHALGALGSDAWFGAATVDVLDVASDTPRGIARAVNAHSVFAPFMSGPGGARIPKYSGAASTALSEGAAAFSVARGVIYRVRQRSLLVASEGSDALVELDADMSDPTLAPMHTYGLETDRDPILGTPLHGGAPSGVALSPDEGTAYVYCRSTDELAVVPLATWDGPFAAAPPRFVKLADEAKHAEFTDGRRLFYAGTNDTLSGGMSCAGCHPEGRDDGHVWHEVVFAATDDATTRFTNLLATASTARHLDAFWRDEPGTTPMPAQNVDATGAGYPRRTPMLVGRVRAIGPYGWHGEAKDLDARILEGFDLHRWSSARSTHDDDVHTAVERAAAHRLANFLRNGLVPPPIERRALSSEEERGRQIFTDPTAACATCHPVGPDLTTREVVPLALSPARAGFVVDPDEKYKVPSLVALAGRPPYMHDGRFETLEELIAANGDRMGKTSQLGEEDKKALVAFLKTL